MINLPIEAGTGIVGICFLDVHIFLPDINCPTFIIYSINILFINKQIYQYLIVVRQEAWVKQGGQGFVKKTQIPAVTQKNLN